jgi:predicted nucleotidyltransferase
MERDESVLAAFPGGWEPLLYEERCRRRRALLSEALADAIDVCRSRDDVARLLVFGSYARDAVSPWSDLDLLVVADGDVRGAVAAIYARGALGDVIGVEADDWRERLRRNPFGETILAESSEVYARPEV